MGNESIISDTVDELKMRNGENEVCLDRLQGLRNKSKIIAVIR